jgi:hypothetical protein
MSAPELTQRQLAARLNRAKRGPLGPESRERLRVAAHINKPWLRTTGPRTDSGKARSRGNALRHGARAELLVPDAVRLAEEARLDGRQVGPDVGWEAVAWLSESGSVTGLVRAARIIQAMGPPDGRLW